ncbi:hypothetical protein ACKKBG_A32700 [Auxenochlorella protothecoides x Auxenochlorella symbiontica]
MISSHTCCTPAGLGRVCPTSLLHVRGWCLQRTLPPGARLFSTPGDGYRRAPSRSRRPFIHAAAGGPSPNPRKIISLPLTVPPAGVTISAAVVLKLLILFFPDTPLAANMFHAGKMPIGVEVLWKTVPVALLLLGIAKWIVDTRRNKTPNFGLKITLIGLAGIILGRLLLLDFAWRKVLPLQAPAKESMQQRAMRQLHVPSSRVKPVGPSAGS